MVDKEYKSIHEIMKESGISAWCKGMWRAYVKRGKKSGGYIKKYVLLNNKEAEVYIFDFKNKWYLFFKLLGHHFAGFEADTIGLCQDEFEYLLHYFNSYPQYLKGKNIDKLSSFEFDLLIANEVSIPKIVDIDNLSKNQIIELVNSYNLKVIENNGKHELIFTNKEEGEKIEYNLSNVA